MSSESSYMTGIKLFCQVCFNVFINLYLNTFTLCVTYTSLLPPWFNEIGLAVKTVRIRPESLISTGSIEVISKTCQNESISLLTFSKNVEGK